MAADDAHRGLRARHPASLGLSHGRFTRLSPRLTPVFAEVRASFDDPYVGVTTDGRPLSGLFPLAERPIRAGAVVDAARNFVVVLSDDERARVMHPANSVEWRRWTNAFPPWLPRGLMLDEFNTETRAACLEIIRASMSERGYSETRQTMLANDILALLTGDASRDSLGEWKYYFNLFGTPSTDEPWGWQLWGHHLHVSCMICRGRMVMTPFFLGAEPAVIDEGQFAGLTVLARERQAGLTFMQSLSSIEQQTALLSGSMRSADLPEHLRHPTEGRMRSGHGRDNLVLPYEGLSCHALTAGQRDALLEIVQCYVGRWGDASAHLKMLEVERYLDQTHFAWVGAIEDASSFYYKIHSPVVLIEYDNHAGVFLDNPEPEPFHVHTMVRTPNGNDYGFDYLRQHYAEHHGAQLRPGNLYSPGSGAC